MFGETTLAYIKNNKTKTKEKASGGLTVQDVLLTPPPQTQFSPLALEGAELVTLGEAEWLELRLEVDGLGCGDRHQFSHVAGKRLHGQQKKRQQRRLKVFCFLAADTPPFFN